MRAAALLLFVEVAILTACSTPPPPPFKPVADVKQVMASIMEPAADEYWDAVGIVIDAKGEHQIEPQTVEEWDAVRNDAYVFTEAGNLLMMSPRAMDGADWMTLSQAFIESGQKAIRAAEARDKTAVFDAGAEVYEACTNCHAKYAVELQKANLRQ
jgi:hypothetical protein